MKKSNLVMEIICAIFGLACLITAIMLDSENNSILCGFAGAGLVSGGLMIYKYFYWKSPKREKQYEEKIKQEKIELNDELKEKARDKSGSYAYIIGLVITGVSIFIFGLLDNLKIIENAKVIVVYLSVFLIFQYIIGIVIYRFLFKKYE